MLDGVLFLFLGKDKELNNCFWKIRVALKRAWLVQLVWANPLIWADCWLDWLGGLDFMMSGRWHW